MGNSAPGEELLVGIDARLRSGQPGGVEQFVCGLAYGLSRLSDGTERYKFLTLPGEDGWLTPFMRGPCELAARPATRAVAAWLTATLPRRAVEAVPRLRPLARAVRSRIATRRRNIPATDNNLEDAGARVIHFPLQSAFATPLPSIYQPWDLQHLHLPEFFSSDEIARREHLYRLFCARAELVVVATKWAKSDFVGRYGIDPSKIAVIPVPPPLGAYAPVTQERMAEIRKLLALPERFLYYPAQTWQHKNHIRLLQALALIRDRAGGAIPLVCTGRRNDHFPTIASEVARLHLEDQVRFLGFVDQEVVQVLYQSSEALIFPSLFEGWGLPVIEAFSIGLPVACSRATSLTELADGAAVLFDPLDSESIADAIGQVWQDADLRMTMAERGRAAVRDLDWTQTARVYRAHYRSIAGQQSEQVDAALVAASLA